MVSRLKITLLIVLMLGAIWEFGLAGKIYVKAWLAQELLENAWQRTLDGERNVRPWPWADTWPVAKITLTRIGISKIVLAGDSGRVLAFGPGYSEASVKPGRQGVTVISGHRDTSFKFLKAIKDGDTIELTTPEGRFRYTVTEQVVVDQRYFNPDVQLSGIHLMLVTCYPFGALRVGGNERFIVVAQG